MLIDDIIMLITINVVILIFPGYHHNDGKLIYHICLTYFMVLGNLQANALGYHFIDEREEHNDNINQFPRLLSHQ